MKPLKQIPALLCAALLLAGCGMNPRPNTVATVSPATQPTAAPTVEVTSATEPQPEASALCAPQITTVRYTCTKEDGQLMVTAQAALIEEPTDPAYQSLLPALQQFNREARAETEQRYAELQEEYRNLLAESPEYGAGISMSEEYTLTVQRADRRLLTLRRDLSGYAGGAHGYYSVSGFNFDAVTGKLLSISDVVADRQALIDTLARQLEAEYGPYLYPDTEPAAVLAEYTDENFFWLLDNQGLRVFFNPYELAPYAAGMQEIFLPYSRYPELIRAEYLPTQSEYVQPFRLQESVMALDKGAEQPLSVGYRWSESGEIDAAVVRLGERELIYPAFSYEPQLYLVNAAGRSYIYVLGREYDDYWFLTVLDPENGSSEQLSVGLRSSAITVEQYDDGRQTVVTRTQSAFTDPNCFDLETHRDAVSTVHVYQTYRVGENGMPVTEDTFYRISSGNCFTTRIPLTARTEQGSLEIPQGTVLSYLATDGSTWAEFSTPDGTPVRMDISVDEWPQTISGIPVEDALEGVSFSA